MNDEDRIRQRARETWQREGRPEGRHNSHWEQAAKEIANEDQGNSATVKSPTPRTGTRDESQAVEAVEAMDEVANPQGGRGSS